MHWLIGQQNKAFTQNNSEKEKFKEEFFLAIEIPTVVYIPWIKCLFRISLAIYEEVYTMIKRKLNTEIYKLFNLFYQLKQFCIIKKDRKSLNIVYSLELLNRVIIVHSELFPAMKELAMYFVEKAYNKILDFYMEYNKQMLVECLQDLTMFQTPFETLTLVILPMYWTNSVPFSMRI